MAPEADGLFDVDVWRQALETYGNVTNLTVALYDVGGHIVCGPMPSTPIFALFQEHDSDPGVFSECAQRCLAQGQSRPAVIVNPAHGVAVVGTSLLLQGQIVGAAVAGYALADFAQSTAIARLARQAGVPFQPLWDLARRQQPVPERRMLLYGELLQVLGDTLLRENLRTRESEEIATQLSTASAAKDEFLAVVSHELRSPLTPILGWARILKSGADPARVARAAEAIERNAVLQLSLVDDLLDLTRATRGAIVLDVRTHLLADVVRAAVDAVSDDAAGKNIAIRFADAGEPLLTQGDANRLQQIFRNVLLNAVKFTPSGGAISVALEGAGGRAVVYVRDTGQGIAPEFLPHVFEMFRQQDVGASRVHGGLGIGLALVRQLIEAHGGTVAIASEGAGCGTEVTLALPLTDGDAPPEAVGEAGTALQDLDGLRVLLIEDMDDAREALSVMLERLGANVVTARDGAEALERVAADSVDLVLCDLMMPRMDGFNFIRALHDAGGDRPLVIAASASANLSDQHAEAAGFDGYLAKPFDDVSLLRVVGRLMARRSA